MPISSSNESRNIKRLPQQVLSLVANFKHIPESATEKSISEPIMALSDVLDKMLQTKYKQSPKVKILNHLQEHWERWFSGTDFAVSFPVRIDRWSCLWLKAPDPIACQKLQLKNTILLKTLNSLLDGAIQQVRWFT